MKLVAPLIATALLAAACIPGGSSDTIEASSSSGSVLGPADAALMDCMTSAGLPDADRIAVASFLNGQSSGVGSPEVAERAGGVLATCVPDNGLKIGTALIEGNDVEDSDRECVLFTSALSSSAVFSNVVLNTPDTAGKIASLYRSECDLSIMNVIELYPIGVAPGVGTLGAADAEQAAPTTTPTTQAPATTEAPVTTAPPETSPPSTTQPATPVAGDVSFDSATSLLEASLLPSPIIVPEGAIILEVDHTIKLDSGPFVLQGIFGPEPQTRRWTIRGMIRGDAAQALASFDSTFWGLPEIDAGTSADSDSSSAFTEFASIPDPADVNGFVVQQARITTSSGNDAELSVFEIKLTTKTEPASSLSGPIVDAVIADGTTAVLPAGELLTEVSFRFDSPWISTFASVSFGPDDGPDPNRITISLEGLYLGSQTDLRSALLDNQNDGYELTGDPESDSFSLRRTFDDTITYSASDGNTTLDPYQIVRTSIRTEAGPAVTAEELIAGIGL